MLRSKIVHTSIEREVTRCRVLVSWMTLAGLHAPGSRDYTPVTGWALPVVPPRGGTF